MWYILPESGHHRSSNFGNKKQKKTNKTKKSNMASLVAVVCSLGSWFEKLPLFQPSFVAATKVIFDQNLRFSLKRCLTCCLLTIYISYLSKLLNCICLQVGIKVYVYKRMSVILSTTMWINNLLSADYFPFF